MIFDQDASRAPADAYYAVACWLGEEALRSPWPDLGCQVDIMGDDGAVAQWHLDRLTASHLMEWVHAQPGLVVTGYAYYDTRQMTP